MINLKSTNELETASINLLVYGDAGTGKTSLIKTLPKPIILSAEGGLLSIRSANLPFVEINSTADLIEAYRFLLSPASADYESVAIDSITEVAEMILQEELAKNKDARQAYASAKTRTTDMIKEFCKLNKNVYFSAQMSRDEDEDGRKLYSPALAGKKLSQSLPYFDFHGVFALRIEKDKEGKPARALLCQPDGRWTAKQRLGNLAKFEQPNLLKLIKKMLSTQEERDQAENQPTNKPEGK